MTGGWVAIAGEESGVHSMHRLLCYMKEELILLVQIMGPLENMLFPM